MNVEQTISTPAASAAPATPGTQPLGRHAEIGRRAEQPAAAAGEDEVGKRRRGLLFDLDKSIRYHQRRRAFFDRLHKGTMLIAILSSTAIVADLAHALPFWLTLAFAGLLAITAAADLVIGYSRAASDHHELARRFADLTVRARVADGSDLVDCEDERVRIERDEPPIFWALEADCYNEALRARDGLEKPGYLRVVPTWRAWLKNLIRFESVDFPHRDELRRA